LATALQITLVGRFYERLGDHAVHVSERVRYLATGT
jgi:phosphate uptake regulator